jgi:hypothetical protein
LCFQWWHHPKWFFFTNITNVCMRCQIWLSIIAKCSSVCWFFPHQWCKYAVIWIEIGLRVIHILKYRIFGRDMQSLFFIYFSDNGVMLNSCWFPLSVNFFDLSLIAEKLMKLEALSTSSTVSCCVRHISYFCLIPQKNLCLKYSNVFWFFSRYEGTKKGLMLNMNKHVRDSDSCEPYWFWKFTLS